MSSDSHAPHRNPTARRVGWTIATLVAFALSALCVAAALLPDDTGHPRIRRVALPPEITACSTDADCALVDRIGCCTCQTGGGQWTVNATQTDALRRFLKHACKNQPACLQIDACRGDLAGVCRNGQCALAIVAPADPDEAPHG